MYPLVGITKESFKRATEYEFNNLLVLKALIDNFGKPLNWEFPTHTWNLYQE